MARIQVKRGKLAGSALLCLHFHRHYKRCVPSVLMLSGNSEAWLGEHPPFVWSACVETAFLIYVLPSYLSPGLRIHATGESFGCN